MRRYAATRLLLFFPTLWGAVTLVFFFLHLMPGDPVDLMIGENAMAADREALRADLGLDRSLPAQYGDYLARLSRGDLGRSWFYRRDAASLIVERIGATAGLAGAALLTALLLSLPLGMLAAQHPRKAVRSAASVVSLLGISLPNFWLGPLLILVFSIGLDWLPVSGLEGPASVILPAVTLGLGMAALLTRMVRSGLLDVRGEEYIRAARAKGVSARALLFKHMLSNALIPLITLVGLQAGALLSGAVITETIFNWPGLGRLLIGALQSRDYPLMQACLLVIAAIYLVINLVVDLLYAVADPTVRLGASR